MLNEAARVARRQHGLMIEPFADVKHGFWPWLNVVRRNYFRGHIDNLPQYGRHPIEVTNDFPQESFVRSAPCCRKSARPRIRGLFAYLDSVPANALHQAGCARVAGEGSTTSESLPSFIR